MKTRFAKILSVVLALIMMLSVLPTAALAQTVDSNGTTLLSGWFNNWWDWFRPRPNPRPTYPAQTLTHESVNGTAVTADIPVGALPDGTVLDVDGITDVSGLQSAVTDGFGLRGRVLSAVDINFMYNGNEMDPREPVTIILTSDALLNAEDVKLIHFDCSAAEVGDPNVKAEIVDQFYLSGNTITFDAQEFSVYAVVGDGTAGDRARLTVEFYNGTQLIDTAYITKANIGLVGNIIPDPTIAQNDGTKVFCGWIIGKPDYDSDDVLGDHTINYVREAVVERLTDTERPVTEGEVMKVYAMFFNYFIISFLGENGDVTRYAEAVYTTGDSIEYEINQPYTPELEGYRFTGWQMAGTDTVYTNGTTVTLMSDTTFRAKVQRGYWLTFEENPDGNHKGATYCAPIFCEDGVVTSAQRPTPKPTLPGYTFVDWYKDKEFTQLFDFNTTIHANTEIYAKWNLNATATYTVLIWQQNLDADGYDFVQSIKINGATNSAINTIVQQGTGNSAYVEINGEDFQYTGFHFKESDVSGKTIAAAGTTVVNVYFDRNQYTLSFEVPNTYTKDSSYGNWGRLYNSNTGSYYYVMLFYKGSDGNYYALDGTTSSQYAYYYTGSSYTQIGSSSRYVVSTWETAHTITALYGQSIASHFPIEEAPEGVLWNPYNSTIFDSSHDVPSLETMPAESTSFRMLFYGVEVDFHFIYYTEALPGEENTVSYGGKNYTQHQDVTIQGQPSVSSTKSEDMYDITGFTQGASYPAYGSDGTVELTSDYNYTIELYYTRNSYKILYQDGSYFDGNQIRIANAPDRGYLGEEGNILYESDISSYNKNGSNYFAPTYAGYMFEGWYLDKTCTQAADFDKMPAGGITVYAKWQLIQYRVYLNINGGTFAENSQESDFRVAQGDKISDGEEIQATKAGYELVGWYTDSDFKNSFNFDTRLNDDTEGMLEYPLTGRTDDVGRYWVTGKLNLYARWRKVLDGANGLTVIYNAVSYIQSPGNGIEGHFLPDGTEWTDPLPYTDGALAIGRTASTPNNTDENVFLYWEIMNADGTPSGKRIYPGQNYTVDYDDAVVSDVTPGGSKGVGSVIIAADSGTGTYELVTTPPSDWSGNYVITYGTTTDMYVMKGVSGSSSGTDIESASNRATYASSGITLSGTTLTGVSNDYVFTIAPSGNYYSVKSVSTGSYLGQLNDTYHSLAAYSTLNTSYCSWTPGYGPNASSLYNASSSSYHYLSFTTTNNYFWSGSTSGNAYANVRLWKEVTNTSATTYTVTFKDHDGTVLKSQEVVEGGNATPPADPTREGYTFAGWSGNYTNVHDDEVVTATYIKETTSGTEIWVPVDTIEPGEEYLIGIIDGGTTYLISSCNVSTSKHYYTEPNSSYELYYMAFMGTAIMDGVNVTGIADTTISDMDHCKWTFSSTNGGIVSSVAESGYYLDGGTGTITSYSSDYYGYTYYDSSVYTDSASWTYNSSNHRMSTGGIYLRHYTGTYSGTTYQLLRATTSSSYAGYIQLYKKELIPNVETYTVKFYGWEGAELSSQDVDEGSFATAPADPTLSGYVFKGWAKNNDDSVLYSKAQVDAMAIEADTDFYAVFETESGNKVYSVIFVNWDGNILKTQYVEEGSGATAPAVPTRENYTFTGWDTYAWESNVTSDLVVTANFTKTVTKQYTITVRAVYGPKAVLRRTHITWHANNGTGEFKNSIDVLMNETIDIEFPEGNPTTGGAKDGDTVVAWPDGGELVWEDHVFLGWARIEIGNTPNEIDDAFDPTDPDYVKTRAFNEDDLFLKYYYPTEGQTKGHFEAEINGTWTTVQYVAADELMPYHAMYAVWADVFYVYHSGTGEVERVIRTTKAGTTFDLADRTSTGCLYGGYYTDYAGKSGEFDAKNVTYTAFRGVADLDEHSENFDKQADTGAVKYDGYTQKWGTDSCTAYTENGLAITPVAGATYYIKEVPADKYLRPYLHYTYYENTAQTIATAWLISDVDDLNYQQTGFVVVSANKKAEKVVSSMTVKPANGSTSITLTPKRLFGANKDNYLTYLTVINRDSSGEDQMTPVLANGNTVLQYWVTPDGCIVTGTVMREYSGLATKPTLEAAPTTVASTIAVFTATPVEPNVVLGK